MKEVCFIDFQPQMIKQPGLITMAEYEPLQAAVDAANQWLSENHVRLINMETVVLPNIWSPHEEGTTDTSLGTRGGGPSHWHQFVRCWYLPLDASGSPTTAASRGDTEVDGIDSDDLEDDAPEE